MAQKRGDEILSSHGCTPIENEVSKRENQLRAIQKMLPAVRAEQSRALLLVVLCGLYGQSPLL